MEGLEAEGLITNWRKRNVSESVWKVLLMRGKWQAAVVLVLPRYILKKRQQKYHKYIDVCFMWPLLYFFLFFMGICDGKSWKSLVETVLSTKSW